MQNDALFVAFYDAAEALRVIHTRHKQGAAYMALGYAPATGKVGAYAVVPGPGFLNTTAALSTAYATNAPVLCIAGQVQSDLIGRAYGLLHEIPDQLGILRSLTKWAERINHPTEAGKRVGAGIPTLGRNQHCCRDVNLQPTSKPPPRQRPIKLTVPAEKWLPGSGIAKLT